MVSLLFICYSFLLCKVVLLSGCLIFFALSCSQFPALQPCLFGLSFAHRRPLRGIASSRLTGYLSDLYREQQAFCVESFKRNIGSGSDNVSEPLPYLSSLSAQNLAQNLLRIYRFLLTQRTVSGTMYRRNLLLKNSRRNPAQSCRRPAIAHRSPFRC